MSMTPEIDDSLNDSREGSKQRLMCYFVDNRRSTWEESQLKNRCLRKQNYSPSLITIVRGGTPSRIFAIICGSR